MKRVLKFLPVVAMALACFACATSDTQPPDPFDVLNDDCTPTTLAFEGQEGNALIVNDPEDEALGTISVVIEIREVNVLALLLENIRLPRGSTATFARGDRLNLLNDVLTVTSESGQTRVYTFIYSEPYRSPLKSILSFEIADQLGAEITEDPNDDTRGEINILYLQSPLTFDLLKLSVSAGASASVAAGSALPFIGTEASFTVTADDASVRTYTVTYSVVPSISDQVAGNYIMSPRVANDENAPANAIFNEGGISGNSTFMTLKDKDKWKAEIDACMKVNDYTITIVATEDTGSQIRGIIKLSAPNDDFFSFIWRDDVDYSSKYELIPPGISYWSRPRSTATFGTGATNANQYITIYKDKEYTEEFTKWYYVINGTRFDSNNSPVAYLTVGLTTRVYQGNPNTTSGTDATIRAFNRPTGWSGNATPAGVGDYDDESRYWWNCRRVLWLVKRTS